MSEECRHGCIGGCYDCLLICLHEGIRVLNDTDAANLPLKKELMNQLKRFMKHAVDEIGRIHISEGHFLEAEEEEDDFEDAVEEPAPKRFLPTIVASSGFGSPRRTAHIPVTIEPQEGVSISQITKSMLPKRRKWSKQQTEDLRLACDKYPNQWETMRRVFPSLSEFSGVQLKDKHRATFGSRKST